MPDALHGFPKPATPPAKHPAIEDIIAPGRAATARRDAHHAESAPLRRQAAESHSRPPEGRA